MKYVLIGCGRIARNHLLAARENKLSIQAICDIVPERMDAYLESDTLKANGKISCYTDYKKMLEENKDIELVSIATESGEHARIALDCIAMGKHVIIEKPMAMSIADADRIIVEAKKKNVKVSVCHQNRFNLAVQALRKALEKGRFGKISHASIHVRWNRDRNYYSQAPWRGTWKEDGGALLNQCIHGIDLLCWMLGYEIETVYGKTRRQFHDYLEAEDVGMAVLSCKNGAIATVEGTTNVFPQNLEETLYIFGERGTAKLGGKSLNQIDVWDFADVDEEDQNLRGMHEKTINVYGNGHSSLFADMIRAIRKDCMPCADALAGKKALEVVLAIYQSSAIGLPVPLPLESCRTLDFVGMFEGRIG